MADHRGGGDDDLDPVEALLREVTEEDREIVPPPGDVWAGIAAQIDRDDSPPEVVDLDRRRRFPRRMAAVGAVAAALVVIVGGIALWSGRDDGGRTVLASTDLAFDPVRFDQLGAGATAHVSLVDDDGSLRLEIDESELPDANAEAADLELWLIEPDADGNPVALVSLGVIDPADPGEFDVPAGYDPDVFSVVDISVEPHDGNPDHSGRSILRGDLIAT